MKSNIAHLIDFKWKGDPPPNRSKVIILEFLSDDYWYRNPIEAKDLVDKIGTFHSPHYISYPRVVYTNGFPTAPHGRITIKSAKFLVLGDDPDGNY